LASTCPAVRLPAFSSANPKARLVLFFHEVAAVPDKKNMAIIAIPVNPAAIKRSMPITPPVMAAGKVNLPILTVTMIVTVMMRKRMRWGEDMAIGYQLSA
jgi:hypothetical protein